MNSAMLSATSSFLDIKDIQKSKLPSKTGAVRVLAVSALVAFVFASTLIPAVLCTGVIAATTAAIMLKNRRIEQLRQVEPLNDNDIVTSFKEKIDSSSEEEKHSLLTVCLSYLTKKTGEMPETIDKSKKFLWISWKSLKNMESYLVKEIQKYVKKSNDELTKEVSQTALVIQPTEEQQKIEKLSIVSILSIVEHLYTKLDKSQKAKEITKLINQIENPNKNPIDQIKA